MPKREFKKGDKVKVTTDKTILSGHHQNWAGRIVTIKSDCRGGGFVPIEEFEDDRDEIPDDRLEKISITLPQELFEI